jgi:hypothetical protein
MPIGDGRNPTAGGYAWYVACAPVVSCGPRRMNRFDDDEDWVGTPPEGRYSRDRADPQFWWRQRPVSIAAAVVVFIVIVVIVVAVLG